MKYFLSMILGLSWSATAHGALTLQQLNQAKTLCDNSLVQCAAQIDGFIAQASPHSAFWYELKLLKFNALFILHQDQQLLDETNAMVLIPELPAYFKANLYVYHAKELLFTGNKLQGQHYLDKASELLEHLSAASRNPLMDVRLVNIQMSLDENRPQGYERLKALEIRYQKSGDWAMKFELYNNLGHITYWLGKHSESVHYRQLCLEAAMHTHNVQFQAEGNYNLARQRTKFQDFATDINVHYLNAIKLYGQIDDQLMVAQSQLFLSELLWQQGKANEAKQMFAAMNRQLIPDYNQQHLQRIQQLMSQ